MNYSSKEMNRERNSPGSLIESVNLASCQDRRNFINFTKGFFRKDFNYWGVLVNSAYVTAEF